MLKKIFFCCVVLSGFFFLSSCLVETESRGYIFENNFVDDISAGKTSKQDILDNMGSPSTTSDLNKEAWFYIFSKFEKVSFLHKKITEHSVVEIDFTEDIVTAVNKYSIDDIKNIKINTDSSVSDLNDISPLEQFLGNIGKYNTEDKIN